MDRAKYTTENSDQLSVCSTFGGLQMAQNIIFDSLIQVLNKYKQGQHKGVRWFLEELDANDYEGYLQKYPGASTERSHFIAVCGFFELSGVLVSYGLIDQNLYFDIFNPTPFWNKAKPIVEGMRTKRPHIYENFELLNNKRLSWTKKRNR